MFFVVARLDVVDLRRVDWFDVVRLLDVKFWETPLMSITKFDGQVWRVLLPALVSKPNTALVMNVFTKETKLCPAFPSPDESASDWQQDASGNYTVKVER